jgi:chemotaxis family two-component system response regulator Rcp1
LDCAGRAHVVLTTSSADQDVLSAYKLHCSYYIVKPVDFEQFVRVIQSITDYWFTVVVLPPKDCHRQPTLRIR